MFGLLGMTVGDVLRAKLTGMSAVQAKQERLAGPRRFCQLCGATPGIPHHDLECRRDASPVVLHYYRAMNKTVCTLCRDGLYAMKRAERRELTRENGA